LTWTSKTDEELHVATENVDENVMKVRLADYLGIGFPSDAAADTGDGDTVDAADNGGVLSVNLSFISDDAIRVEMECSRAEMERFI
jgi:hypothetical protein